MFGRFVLHLFVAVFAGVRTIACLDKNQLFKANFRDRSRLVRISQMTFLSLLVNKRVLAKQPFRNA